MEDAEKPQAAFVVAATSAGSNGFLYHRSTPVFCAVVRRDGSIGFPGGMVKQGESLAHCAEREAEEEGWGRVIVACRPFLEQEIDGLSVSYFAGYIHDSPAAMEGEVIPVYCPEKVMAKFFKNSEVIKEYKEFFGEVEPFK